jgi:disulfide bond formation protein DsbB
MIEVVETFNFYIALAGIVVFLGATVLIVDLKTTQEFKLLVRRFGGLLALFMTLVASGVAFVYSDVFGFIPCGLCWLQRVFLFSQPFIIGTGLYFNDAVFPRYGIVLSGTGLIIGLYQHYLQMGGSEFVNCPAAGEGSDCAARYLFEFGFVTYPLVCVFFFAFLIALYYYMLKTRQG